MAPFALLSPVIGPFLDRRSGARRLMILTACAGRAAICVLIAARVDSLALYPAAFVVLVLSKSYGIARAAIVPSLAPPGKPLVAVNARLAKVAIAAGAIVAIPGIAFLQIIDAGAVMTLAAVVFAFGAVLSLALPRAQETSAAEDLEDAAVAEAFSLDAIRRAAIASALSRALVGFLIFLLAFGLKRAGEGSAGFGFVLGCAGVGSFAGAVIVPRLRRGGTEEWVIAASLLLGAGASLIAQSNFGLDLAAVLGGAVGIVASGVRLGFEALVQRECPVAARGRVFARFETLFQIAWVIGAALPTVFPIGIRGGLISASILYVLTGVGFFASLGREGRARLG
jgi:hypothetical protein